MVQAGASSTAVASHFNEVAATWIDRYRTNRSFVERLRSINAELNALPLPSNASVLDFGGGAGVFSVLATGVARDVMCLEPNAAMVAAGQTNSAALEDLVRRYQPTADASRVRWVEGGLGALSGTGETFDLILAISVLEYLPSPNEVLRGLSDHLKPGGLLLVTTPDETTLFRRIEPGLNRLASRLARVIPVGRLRDREYSAVRPSAGVDLRPRDAGLTRVRRVGLAMGSGPISSRVTTMRSEVFVRPASGVSPAPRTRTHAVAVAPSRGLGGGIERYVESVLDLIRPEYDVVDVFPSGPLSLRRKVTFSIDILRTMRSHRESTSVVLCFHPGLLPLTWLTSKLAGDPELVCFYYGAEIWSASRVSRFLWRNVAHLPVTISSFSAGALTAATGIVPSIVTPPVPDGWAETLLASGEDRDYTPFKVLSVFRLSAYEEKGAPELIEAAERVRAEGHDLQLTIAGVGPTPPELHLLVKDRPWCRVIADPTSDALAALFADATMFALATRVATDPTKASGEGFGIVLVEAALAGLASIAPASGGARDAMVDQFTGVCLNDDTVPSLAGALRAFGSAEVRATLGRNARRWSRDAFGPQSRSARSAALTALFERSGASC